MAIIERFLHGLRPDGRVGAKTLIDHSRSPSQDFTSVGYLTFKNTCKMLPDFTSLNTLSLIINEHYRLRNDQLALEGFFLRGQELNVDGLTSFQAILRTLPKLRNAEVHVHELGHYNVRVDWS
jgi:hypothetical protein